MKIVVVEDETRIRNGLVALIQKIAPDCRVVGDAENGYEGLKLIRESQPDLVITDVKMPKMDGLRMIEEIRGLGLAPKIVILSGYAEFSYAQKGIQLGVADYLLKPVKVQDVQQLLRKMQAPSAQQPVDHREYSDLVQAIVSTIEQGYGQRLGLDTFATKFKLTPEYISVQFARETGETFSNYLRRVRMEHAKEFLHSTGLKIYEIACRVGYPDQKYFSKVFKEYTGVSPKQFVIKSKNTPGSS